MSTNPICDDYADQVHVITDLPSDDPEFLNQQLSFPYPDRGPPTRPMGQGCRVCVHQQYCPALFWFRMNVQEQPDEFNGRDCLSWSDDIADRPPEITGPDGTGSDYDNAENARRNCAGVLREPNRNGITGPITGGDRG